MRLALILDGARTCVRYSLDEAADRIATAHLDGETWDARVAVQGTGYRPLTQNEAGRLLNQVTFKLGEIASGRAGKVSRCP